MDIYDYLKADHKKVANLFKLYESAPTKRNKLEIFEYIKKELLVHADTEANTFYKALEAYKQDEELISHAENEHAEIKQQLKEISQLRNVDAEMDEKILLLKKAVEHHVSEEEGNVFKAAKKILSEEQAYYLKEQMHDLKEKMLNAAKTADKLNVEIIVEEIR